MATINGSEMIMTNTILLSVILFAILMLSLIMLSNLPVQLIFGQEQTTQTGQQGESSSSTDPSLQQKVRCSNGSVVDTSSECPLPDICPSSPQSGNGTTECHSNSVAIETEVGNQGEQQAVTITTDKNMYASGEVVNITISNIGTEPLAFPNAALGVTIENSMTHVKYPLLSAEVITTLDSGGKKSINWDQVGSSGQKVPPGNYTVTTSAGSLTANVTFTIS
jgi:hypothetical protein